MVGDNEPLQRCLDSAYRYLSYRPRSEAEIRQYLKRRNFDSEVVEKTIAKLKEQKLIDDVAFAQFWKSNRLSFKPKSKRLIVKELKDKKIAPEVIEQVTQNIDDEANAYKLGSSRMHTLGELNYLDFYRRLSSYLSYRGFSYAVIRQTLSRLWEEKKQISNQISL
jgi:regulatory protein